jgi:predicted unusual protein kinase regulating ubiquinone biosynthesis (AarF/ABC1/UbiB family)
MGPVLASFAAYLSTRADLLPYRDCLELAAVQDESAPTPLAVVESTIRQELGHRDQDILDSLDPTPAQRSFLYQWHRAVLPGGEEVTVKVVRAETEGRAAADLELLPVIEQVALTGQDLRELVLADAVTDFSERLQRQLDLTHELNGLEQLATEVSGFEMLVVPECYHDYCAPRVLTYSWIEGQRLDSYLEEAAGATGDDQRQRQELARRLCIAWLQQCLIESTCAQGDLDSWLLLDDNRFAVTGGELAILDATVRENLLDYLIAARKEEPDHAATYLLQEVKAAEDAASRDRLRMLLRQAEPFRDGGWSDHFAGQRMADSLLVQWRLCRRAGYRPSSHMLAFWRGLFSLELLTRRLAPEQDSLKQGVDDLRLVAAAAHLRKELGPSRFAANLEQTAPVLQELMVRGDEVSRLLEQGRLRINLASEPDQEEASQPKSRWQAALSLLLALVVLVVVSHRLTLTQLNPGWVQSIAAATYTGTALIGLWLIVRNRR